MKRDLNRFKNTEFDILIIGGGVSGASIAWDAALRGYKTALIERKDFGHGTSSSTSKLIHGGLRYLAQFDIPVVRESLQERRLLEKNMPHLAFPLPFLLPIYKWQPMPRWMLWAGLTIYDILSYDKNYLDDPDKHLPNKKWISAKEALSLEPKLDQNGLRGAFLYYDVLNKHPHRSNLEYVLSAENKGAAVANYVSCENFLYAEKDGQKKVSGVQAKDLLTGNTFDIKSYVTVNATGPWGDLVLSKLNQKPVRQITRSKGIHILLPRVHKNTTITYETRDKKHFFIIPWLKYTLIGTTDTPFEGHPDDLRVTRKDAQDLLDLTNEYYPTGCQYSDIRHAYAGIRPLVAGSEDKNTYKASRKHEIVLHRKEDQIDGLVSVFGGKWTTSRSLAQDTVDLIEKNFKFRKIESQTANTPVTGGLVGDRLSDFIRDMQANFEGRIPESTLNHLLGSYGVNFLKVAEIAWADAKRFDTLGPHIEHLSAEVVYAVQEEMAENLSDVLLRRIGLGNEGIPSQSVLEKIADIMGNLKGWDTSRKKSEIEEYIASQKIVDA